MVNHVFISPHLDDAIASCGGSITKLTLYDKDVIIFNLFAGSAQPPCSPTASQLHKLWGNPIDVPRVRRAEDKAAAARLGVSVHCAHIPDSLYRMGKKGNWLYPKVEDLFGKRHIDDDWLISYFTCRLTQLFKSSETHLYTTFGIGHHVDHLIAFEVGQKLNEKGYKVLFYEDFPYVNNEDELQCRFDNLEGWSSQVELFNDQIMLTKIEAFNYYRSQIRMLFGDRAALHKSFKENAMKVSESNHLFGERYWRKVLK